MEKKKFTKEEIDEFFKKLELDDEMKRQSMFFKEIVYQQEKNNELLCVLLDNVTRAEDFDKNKETK